MSFGTLRGAYSITADWDLGAKLDPSQGIVAGSPLVQGGIRRISPVSCDWTTHLEKSRPNFEIHVHYDPNGFKPSNQTTNLNSGKFANLIRVCKFSFYCF